MAMDVHSMSFYEHRWTGLFEIGPVYVSPVVEYGETLLEASFIDFDTLLPSVWP
jgi:hypothetical protein